MSAIAPGSDFRSLSRQPPPDPDVQATLSDFLTYTEHFPSHIIRALTLIQDRRARTEQKIKLIHDHTTIYSTLPTIKHDHPDPVALRRDISYALEEAEKASRMALEEATRLDDMCLRESKRLDLVVQKLKAQPLPPSRDATPEPQPLTSPNLRRERGALTRPDEGRLAHHHSRHLDDKAATKLRGRKVMVPGEVLPPPDPNAPPESISDWTSPAASPPPADPLDIVSKHTPRARTRTPKLSRSDRSDARKRYRMKKEKSADHAEPADEDDEMDEERAEDRKTPKPRMPRLPGQPGTNAHSAVAGISTSNALLALTAPPPDAAPGSKWLPWMKLTEWEMAKLRKRMKKNAIWVPSQTMVRRELKNLGRGLAGKELARTAAEAGGDPFVDEHSEADPTKVMIEGDAMAESPIAVAHQVYAEDEDADAELVNRGMRLNEAKKLKRQRMMEEQALQAQLAREQGVESIDIRTITAPSDSIRKRKRDSNANEETSAETGAVIPESKPFLASKRLKVTGPSPPQGSTTAKAMNASAGSSVRTRRAATPSESPRNSIVLKAGKAVSEEPPSRRSNLRRESNVSLPNDGTLPSPNREQPIGTRRSRRPAPGILTSVDHESAKVGVSKRKAAPRKKLSTSRNANAEVENGAMTGSELIEEEIDPDEPRYCICGDVSWGTMIACDKDDCEKEWFHLSCVGLSELPPRRTKWYCPDCRKKLKVGQSSNGLLGKVQGR